MKKRRKKKLRREIKRRNRIKRRKRRKKRNIREMIMVDQYHLPLCSRRMNCPIVGDTEYDDQSPLVSEWMPVGQVF